MKFTSKDLMKAMGLNVGDYIRIGTKELEKYTFLVDDEDGLMLIYEDYEYPIGYLLDHDYEILPRPKRIGELKCSHDDTLNCTKCPLFVFCHATREYDNKALYDVLDKWFNCSKDQEIYDLLKTRLDKVVSE